MNRNRWNFWLAVCGTSLCFVLAMAGARAQSAAPQAPTSNAAAPRLAEEQFKNIQALKGIPAEQVIPSMQFIAALIRYAETTLGRNPTQIDFADYRDANGVKVPFRWTLARPGNRFTIQVEQVQQNVPVDDARFAAPPLPAAPPKPAKP